MLSLSEWLNGEEQKNLRCLEDLTFLLEIHELYDHNKFNKFYCHNYILHCLKLQLTSKIVIFLRTWAAFTIFTGDMAIHFCHERQWEMSLQIHSKSYFWTNLTILYCHFIWAHGNRKLKILQFLSGPVLQMQGNFQLPHSNKLYTKKTIFRSIQYIPSTSL
jgi:hypothetical protein